MGDLTWAVEYTDEFGVWWDTLDVEQQVRVDEAVRALEQRGPALGRPLVDTLSHTHLPNLKELRPPATAIRVLFAFDPRRTALLLLGGDKSGRWQQWYREAIPVAERLYAQHLQTLQDESEHPDG